MCELQQARAKRELDKYLQVVQFDGFDKSSQVSANSPFNYALSRSSPLREALTAHLELTALRLGVLGAFFVLTDGNNLRFLAGTQEPRSCPGKESRDTFNWLETTENDLRVWRSLFQNTIWSSQPSAPFVDDLSSLSSNNETPRLSFYAATPLISERGIHVGVTFLVDHAVRESLSEEENDCVKLIARKCMMLLDFSLYTYFEDRRARVGDQLCRFVQSESVRSQILEELPALDATDESDASSNNSPKHELEQAESQNVPSQKEEKAAPEPDEGTSEESDGVERAKMERNKPTSNGNAEHDWHSGDSVASDRHSRMKSETTCMETSYGRVFGKAAECLQEALDVDGVLFSAGITSFRRSGGMVAETRQELERELGRKPSRKERATNSAAQKSTDSVSEASPGEKSFSNSLATRSYTSAKQGEGTHTERPAEILGLCIRGGARGTDMQDLSRTTRESIKIDGRLLQKLMERYTNGGIWYFDHATTNSYFMNDDVLTESELEEEIGKLATCFPGVRQLIFQPLIDPVSLKSLAGCFCWSNRELPVFTDSVDLTSLKGFVHAVESETSRLDIAAALKQREAFVSSVSHELRTPLHGILGAAQLLEDTTLDSFQIVLADTIRSCGSTLHDTLTSVLFYAKINEFEQRQNKERGRQPSDSMWALSDKQDFSSDPSGDNSNIYTSVNLAMLCEEIAVVLEAGRSFDESAGPHAFFVILEIEYQDNWCFYTEPGALRRMAINIIGNALKYTANGSVHITLRLSKETPDEKVTGGDRNLSHKVEFIVKDTGKGMSKVFLDNHLFSAFTQEDAGSSSGVGLGMSIVKTLVTFLNGDIQVQSEVRVGTQIQVNMPMRMCDPKKGELPDTSVNFTRSIQDLRNRRFRILLFGFAGAILDVLSKYLLDWFHCSILDVENMNDVLPDVIMLQEGNSEATAKMEEAAKRYGDWAVLLKIVVNPAKASDRMTEVPGFRQIERVPRPLGPHNLRKALSSCLTQLERLRGGEEKVEERTKEATSGETRIEDEPAPDENQKHQPSDTGDDYQPLICHEEAALLGSTTSQSRAGKTTPIEELSGFRKDAPGLKVLLVDDNMLNRKLLGAFLTKYGCHDILEAENGALALEAVKSHKEGFDIIFMDLCMPAMNGFEATSAIRRIERRRAGTEGSAEAPGSSFIVTLTGLACAKDEEKAFKTGVDVYLTKPVKFDDLKSLLKKYERTKLESAAKHD